MIASLMVSNGWCTGIVECIVRLDFITLYNHAWIDHNTFKDRDTADSTLPHYFGVLYQVHDGQLDITNARIM